MPSSDLPPATPTPESSTSTTWLALAIGNSRCHWGQFSGTQLQSAWDTPHLSSEAVYHLMQHSFDFSTLSQPTPIGPFPAVDLWIASVVPAQTALWTTYSRAHCLTLEQIPLQKLYATFGIDRALAVVGAIAKFGNPVLVVDAGTALTFTGADQDGLVGGAILPGLRLQFQALGQGTAALPLVPETITLPPRWATTTTEAIASGVVYTLLAGVREFSDTWLQQFPKSSIVLTGGDSDRLHQYLQHLSSERAAILTVAPHLVLEGISAVKEGLVSGL